MCKINHSFDVFVFHKINVLRIIDSQTVRIETEYFENKTFQSRNQISGKKFVKEAFLNKTNNLL